jgi:hypothetical protein
MRLPFLVSLFLAVAICMLAFRTWPSSAVAPREVDVRFDSALVPEGAMIAGNNEVLAVNGTGDSFGGAERREVTVEPLPDAGFHVTIRGRGDGEPTYRYVTELWVEFDDDGDPRARADFHAGPAENAGLHAVLDLTGDVFLGDGLRRGARADVPGVLTYSITGDYGGSDATSSGKVRLR